MDFIPKPPEVPSVADTNLSAQSTGNYANVSASIGAMPSASVNPKPEIDLAKPKIRLSLSSIIVFLLVLALLVLTGLSYFANNKKESEIASLESRLENLEGMSGNSSKATLSTKKSFFDDKDAERILAYNMLARVFELNRSASSSDVELVKINSVSGNELGELTVNIETSGSSTDPYVDTALLLREFKKKAYFEDTFIPSIGSSLTQLGQDLLNYSLRVKYVRAKDTISGFLDFGSTEEVPAVTETESETSVNTLIDQVRGELNQNLTTVSNEQ